MAVGTDSTGGDGVLEEDVANSRAHYTKSLAADEVIVASENTSADTGAHAVVEARATGGDALFRASIAGGGSAVFGVNNSESDLGQLGNGTALANDTGMCWDSSGNFGVVGGFGSLFTGGTAAPFSVAVSRSSESFVQSYNANTSFGGGFRARVNGVGMDIIAMGAGATGTLAGQAYASSILLRGDTDFNVVVSARGTGDLTLGAGGAEGTQQYKIDGGTGDHTVGIGDLAVGNANDNLFFPSCNGVPTSTPTVPAGYVAVRINRAAGTIYLNSGSGWAAA